MGVTHDFRESLALSQATADEPFWEDIYRRAFHGFASMVCVRDDGWAQRGGIDRVITLNSGKTITVDEKLRETDWPDILLERWSNEARRIPGWVQKDLACDFIAYAFRPSRTCYLLPTLALRKTWLTHGREWIAEHREIRARNKGYVTVSIAVPIDVVLDAIKGAMVVGWGEQ